MANQFVTGTDVRGYGNKNGRDEAVAERGMLDKPDMIRQRPVDDDRP